jgi:glutamate synthase (NADPH/NADH) large chain
MSKNTFDPTFRQKEQQRLAQDGLYLPETETAACGVGLIAAIDGKPSRDITSMAIKALKALWHRGAVDADGKTGDGAGIHLQIPREFFSQHVKAMGRNPGKGKLAVGHIFLPRFDIAHQERCRQIIEKEVLKEGFIVHGWRQVTVNTQSIGDKAESTRPEVEQIILEDTSKKSSQDLEKTLFLIRRRIEKQVIADSIPHFYICSLSHRSIIYKGLFLAEQLTSFYPDLLDELFVSNFAIYHQRFSTNTFPSWPLAQPFRILAHNGEINTVRGNTEWNHIREHLIAAKHFKETPLDVSPVIPKGCSDSAALDAVFELFLRTHNDLPETKNTLMPAAWEHNKSLNPQEQDFHLFADATMEPWDGPASICAYDGTWALAGLDRNGLRPLRYTLSHEGYLIIGSETGMVPVDYAQILESGRIGPGDMIAVNLSEGKLYKSHELKQRVASSKNFSKLTQSIKNLSQIKTSSPSPLKEKDLSLSDTALLQFQLNFGWSLEDVELLLHVMAHTGKEATGSMGDDSPIALLSSNYRSLHHFFRQNFSQVTNPAVDSLRERYVMSLSTYIGTLSDPKPPQHVIKLDTPVLSLDQFNTLAKSLHAQKRIAIIDTSFPASSSLEHALQNLQILAEQAVQNGHDVIALSQNQLSQDNLVIPSILATAAVHRHLIAKKLRHHSSILVFSGEVLDVQPLAVLIAVGATAVIPYLAELSIKKRHALGLLNPLSLEKSILSYHQALCNGLLKILAKSGISVLNSYRGGYNFEAVGLSRSLVDAYFPQMPSRISGIGLKGINVKLREQHLLAFTPDTSYLPVGGLYRSRISSQEPHGWDANTIHTLQHALETRSYTRYKKFSNYVHSQTPTTIRDLLDFNHPNPPIEISHIESLGSIRRRLVTPGVSLGALSLPAHETLAIAMNRIGCRSDSGEGGEDSKRYTLRESGDNPCSAIKQIASGRFGVTAEYLNHCDEIEIKIAQGAKPGEGGQLPGLKVSEMIAKLRHSTPGVTLISPPPHHDIYSIEDLAQLIYDLKQINPRAEVCVKLVARAGIGTVAAGVAKAHADVILISGHSGGTGASPQSSIKYAGIPWEIGLAEVHQVLCLNQQRERVKLRTDGGLKTGRDVVIAAILGAEEFGIGTASLIAMGCLMVRQCHSNTCPVGVCTQNPKLIEKFTGTPEKVINLFTFIAHEIQEILAELGVKSLNDIIGRTEFLKQVHRGAEYLDGLDLNPLLVKAVAGREEHNNLHCTRTTRNPVLDTLDSTIEKDIQPFFSRGQKMSLEYTICNTDRSVGTRLSSRIVNLKHTLNNNHISIRFIGSAGQSFGAFGARGLRLEITGDANDYVGKGLSGAHIIIAPPLSDRKPTPDNAIAGNTILYGATSGSLFAAGYVGERFAVRNSGAIGVVEGCGDNGCEYMTGGTVLILGKIGTNFAAGMTGGQAFVYDPQQQLPSRLNGEFVQAYPLVKNSAHAQLFFDLVAQHFKETSSAHAQDILKHKNSVINAVWHIVPNEMTHLFKDLPKPSDLSRFSA